MAEPQYQMTVNGQEVLQQDANLLGQVSGLADDRLLSELVRMVPFDGTNVYKAIMPFGVKGPPSTSTNHPKGTLGTVALSDASNGAVQINPFRAIVGSRTTLAVNSELQNWRDIRSGIFVNAGGGTLAKTIALASNSSGNSRWDLVYATLSVDVASATVTRKVKDPTAGTVAPQNVSVTLSQPVTVAVLTGTPGASPVIPTLPADSGNTYNIPLAAVRVYTGFTSGASPLNVSDIRDLANTGLSSVADLSGTATGAIRSRVANGNNDGAGTYAAHFPWSSAAGQRPAVWLPPQMIGGEVLLVQVDLRSNASPSHPNGSVVDDTSDWRNRFFKTWALAGATAAFGTDITSGGPSNHWFPNSEDPAFATQEVQFSSSMLTVGSSLPTYSGVYAGSNGTNGNIQAGATVNLRVDADSGNLVINWTGTPACRLFFWIEASGRYPNFFQV